MYDLLIILSTDDINVRVIDKILTLAAINTTIDELNTLKYKYMNENESERR